MGIHNSSNLSTEWRVANHINMKAFMTICALLAGSASADPQYLLRSGIPYSTQLTPFSYSYQLAPTVGYSNVLHLIKREADPESPYAYEAKVVNPADGSKYQFDVEVDQFGDGKSHQRVEQHDNTPVARDNYLMDQAMIEQNRMDRLRMDRMRQRVMEQNLNEQRRAEPMMLEKERQDQRLMYQNQMDQRQMPQGQMAQRQMSQNQMNQRQLSQNQMSQRQMPQNEMSQRQMPQNEMDQSRMDQMGNRMANPMMRIGNQNDPRMYSRMEQDKMDMVKRRMLDNNRRQTGGNRMMRNDNMIERGQMQSGRMMKREAGPSFSYTVSTGHPSEQSLRMIDTINYLMPIVDSIPLQSLHQVHPDGGVSYRLPSLMMTYTMRPASMMVGSAVDVQQGGQSYGFRTRA